MKSIAELRREIDGIDGEIVRLIIRRMELSREIGRSKDTVTDKSREMQVILNVRNEAGDQINPAFLREIYERIILESRRIQLS